MAIKDNYELIGTELSNPIVAEAVLPATVTDDDMLERPSTTAIMVGTGLVGWVLGGPFIAIITSLGGKYAADSYGGILGDLSVAVGNIAAEAGKKAEEEQLLNKSMAVIYSLWSKISCQGWVVVSKDADDDIERDIERPSVKAIMIGTGLVGWVLGGPCIAIISSLGGRYAATRNGTLSEWSIAIGRIATAAGKKAEEVRLVDKAKTPERAIPVQHETSSV